jgi:hypothetical protein
MNRVRVGRQQLSVDLALCRSQLGRHTECLGEFLRSELGDTHISCLLRAIHKND